MGAAALPRTPRSQPDRKPAVSTAGRPAAEPGWFPFARELKHQIEWIAAGQTEQFVLEEVFSMVNRHDWLLSANGRQAAGCTPAFTFPELAKGTKFAGYDGRAKSVQDAFARFVKLGLLTVTTQKEALEKGWLIGGKQDCGAKRHSHVYHPAPPAKFAEEAEKARAAFAQETARLKAKADEPEADEPEADEPEADEPEVTHLLEQPIRLGRGQAHSLIKFGNQERSALQEATAFLVRYDGAADLNLVSSVRRNPSGGRVLCIDIGDVLEAGRGKVDASLNSHGLSQVPPARRNGRAGHASLNSHETAVPDLDVLDSDRDDGDGLGDFPELRYLINYVCAQFLGADIDDVMLHQVADTLGPIAHSQPQIERYFIPLVINDIEKRRNTRGRSGLWSYGGLLVIAARALDAMKRSPGKADGNGGKNGAYSLRDIEFARSIRAGNGDAPVPDEDLLWANGVLEWAAAEGIDA